MLAIFLLVATVSTPPQHQRPADNTFLTYPEWFLVFSPAEYASFVKTQSPSDFPFLGHVRQFWQGYHAVWTATRGRYPFNAGYHLMIMVIGTSTTGEYAVRSVYETLIGRTAELTRRHGPTQEEVLGARVAQEYVDFIRVWPWYEFDFTSRLKQVWRDTDLWGQDPIRKWERKYALTSEYASKALYGWVIKKATRATYGDPPLTVTAVVLDRGHGPESVELPRYQAFTGAAFDLAKQGVKFQEIAGNRDVILLSVIERNAATTVPYEVLLRTPILTEPGAQRLLVSVPIASLDEALRRFGSGTFTLEHVYDF